jgi:hypothetical protein
MIMRKIHKDYPVQVFEFSPIHFRIIGKISIDYWPSTGRAWITGSNDYAVKLEPESVFGFAIFHTNQYLRDQTNIVR